MKTHIVEGVECVVCDPFIASAGGGIVKLATELGMPNLGSCSLCPAARSGNEPRRGLCMLSERPDRQATITNCPAGMSCLVRADLYHILKLRVPPGTPD